MKNDDSSQPVFQPVSKTAWLDKLVADLKGKSVSDLDWQLEESLRLAPFYTAEDITELPEPIIAGKSDNQWQIGEYHAIKNLGEANAAILESLNGGVTAPLFKLYHLPTLDELEVLFEGVEPSFISAHFATDHPGKDPAELFRNLILYVRRKGYKLSSINGSIDFDPLLDWTEPPFKPLVRIIQFAHRQTPAFKVLTVNGRTFQSGPENTTNELALTIAKGVTYLRELQKRGVSCDITNAHLQFSMAVDNSYFLSIAKIRALNILWANVLAAYGLEDEKLPPIAVHFSPGSYTDDLHNNMIKAATQAMSAAIGGANYIFVRPADLPVGGTSTPFTRRIARNVQHLLQLESHLDQVIDPAAGSYYIETLTKELADKAWAVFQKIEKKGGFLEVERL